MRHLVQWKYYSYEDIWMLNFCLDILQGCQIRSLATKEEVDENIRKFKSGNYETVPDPGKLQHFKYV